MSVTSSRSIHHIATPTEVFPLFIWLETFLDSGTQPFLNHSLRRPRATTISSAQSSSTFCMKFLNHSPQFEYTKIESITKEAADISLDKKPQVSVTL